MIDKEKEQMKYDLEILNNNLIKQDIQIKFLTESNTKHLNHINNQLVDMTLDEAIKNYLM